MDYATPSDVLLRFALLGGLLVLLLALLLLATIAVLRYVADQRKSMEDKLASRWQPVFFHVMENLPIVIPSISESERQTVLLLWIHFTELVRGEARTRLKNLALKQALDHTAHELLTHPNMRSRLVATVALGHMSCNDSWGDLAALVRDTNPILSLLAVRSLLQIDPRRAAPILMYEMVFRQDWPIRNIVATLSGIEHSVLIPDLLHAIRMAEMDSLPRLLRVAEIIQPDELWPLLTSLLDIDRPTEVLIAALKATRDVRNLPMVRPLARHKHWPVRAQAAATLGRLGSLADQKLLESLLSDDEWWVRYRAATALTKLPSLTALDLLARLRQLKNPLAVEILAQALAEAAGGRLQ